MLTLERLAKIRLTAHPKVQRLVAYGVLAPNYNLPPRVRIRFEGFDNVPDHPVLFAMNHTDRYNYWPFQYRLWRSASRFTATWVKGKYYQNPYVGRFMELTNNIPTVSRGYLLSRDFVNVMGRAPKDEEYETLRRLIEATADAMATGRAREDVSTSGVPPALLTTPRDLLGRRFDPEKEDYPTAVVELFKSMMRIFTALNLEALDKGLDTLIFPQGTRSIHLSRGHGGIAQIALAHRRTIVPVGCNGSDEVYTTSAPIAQKGGDIVYRFGRPVLYDEMSRFHTDDEFEPFTPEAEHAHRERFQGYVDVVMDRINDLLDPKYRFSDSAESGGVRGIARFV